MITTQKEFLSLLRKAKKTNSNIKWFVGAYKRIRGKNLKEGYVCCPGTFALNPLGSDRDLYDYNFNIYRRNNLISSKLYYRIVSSADNLYAKSFPLNKSFSKYLRNQMFKILKPEINK